MIPLHHCDCVPHEPLTVLQALVAFSPFLVVAVIGLIAVLWEERAAKKKDSKDE